MKPCPFCKKDNQLIIVEESVSFTSPVWYSVHCNSCNARGPDSNDDKQAVILWNRAYRDTSNGNH